MENVKPYNDFGDFLRKVFPCKVQKISINAGFTCPEPRWFERMGRLYLL